MIPNIEQEDLNPNQDKQSQNVPSTEAAQQTEKPLTTQGTQEEIEENLGGTTNLSLDQTKKEGDAGH